MEEVREQGVQVVFAIFRINYTGLMHCTALLYFKIEQKGTHKENLMS